MKSLTNIISVPLFKENLRRFWTLSALSGIVFFLTVVMLLLSEATRGNQVQLARQMVSILTFEHPITITWMLIAPFCMVMALYPHSFNKQAASAFYTWPITKSQLFWTNFASSIALMLLPFLALCIILLVPVFVPPAHPDGWIAVSAPSMWISGELLPGDLINTPIRVLTFFARASIGAIFYLIVFKLAAVVAGNRVIAILLCIAFPLLPAAVHFIVIEVGRSYVFGLNSMAVTRAVSVTNTITNPAMWASTLRSWHTSSNELFYGRLIIVTIAHVAIGAILLLVAFACNARRKHERIEDSIVFDPLKKVLVFLVAFCGMIVGGWFFSALFRRGSQFGLYIGFAVGFVISYFIAQMIAEKSLNVRHKAKGIAIYASIVFAMYVGMLFVTHVAMRPFINHVPHRDTVQGIRIQEWGTHQMFITDDDVIDAVIALHQNILDNQRYLRRMQHSHYSQWGWHSQVSITYLLEDGRTIYRSYLVSHSFRESSGLEDIVHKPVVALSRHELLHTPQDLTYITIRMWTPGHENFLHVATIVDQDIILPLVDIIKEEYLNNLARNVWTADERFFHMEIVLAEESERMGRVDWISFSVLESDTIMQWIRDMGFLDDAVMFIVN